jgi:chromosome segregation ATPase
LETKLREVREFAAQNQQRVRQQMSGLNKDKSDLNATVTELRSQIQKLTTERDSLKAGAGAVPESPDSRSSAEQIEVLRNEKAALEASLAEARSKISSETLDQNALIVGSDLIINAIESLYVPDFRRHYNKSATHSLQKKLTGLNHRLIILPTLLSTRRKLNGKRKKPS